MYNAFKMSNATHTPGEAEWLATGKVSRPVQPTTLNHSSNNTSSTNYRPGMVPEEDGDRPPAVPRTKKPRHSPNDSPQNAAAAATDANAFEMAGKAPDSF